MELVPESQILGQTEVLRFDLMPRSAEIQIGLPSRARPHPDFAEHFAAHLEQPREMEQCHFARGSAEKLLEDRPAMFHPLAAFNSRRLPMLVSRRPDGSMGVSPAIASQSAISLAPGFAARSREQLDMCRTYVTAFALCNECAQSGMPLRIELATQRLISPM